MSRAFTKEADGDPPPRRYLLPAPDDPGFPMAAAAALLEGARIGEIRDAEEATGRPWASPDLVPQVERLLADAEATGDDRLVQMAERFLRHAREAGS